MKKMKSIGWGFGRCNMNCKHCYSAGCNSCPQYDFETLKKIADKICPETTTINFGTGEFGFNMNTFSLAQYIKEKYPHVMQAVTTNGATIVLRRPEEIKAIFHDIDFSLDFPDPERHNNFRQHPLAWDMVMKDMKICHQEGIEASIVTCITGLHSNKDIQELLEIAQKFNCSWRVNWFRPAGRGNFQNRLNLSPKRVWQIIKLLSEIATVEALSDPLFDAILGTNYQKYNGCACGTNSCRIQTSLAVTPCVFLGGQKWSGGSIASENLDTIFQSQPFKKILARKPEKCLACEFWEKCRGGCASRAVLYQGGINKPDGFCPIVNNLPMDEIKSIKVRIAEKTESKVHDGYLCTSIFKPI